MTIYVFFHFINTTGKKHNVHWTRLKQTLAVDSSTIQLVEPVDWSVGDEIVITTTTFEPRQAEKFIIKEIKADGNTLELETAAKYIHSAYTGDFNGQPFTMSAKVGLEFVFLFCFLIFLLR